MAEHNEFGKKGEEAAFETLLKQGYIIREQNWRCGKAEIDIVAEKDNRIIIVEVKTRSEEIEDLCEVIDKKKIGNLIKAGTAYINQYELPHELQFDIILLTGTPDNFHIEHYIDAIMPQLKAL